MIKKNITAFWMGAFINHLKLNNFIYVIIPLIIWLEYLEAISKAFWILFNLNECVINLSIGILFFIIELIVSLKSIFDLLTLTKSISFILALWGLIFIKSVKILNLK